MRPFRRRRLTSEEQALNDLAATVDERCCRYAFASACAVARELGIPVSSLRLAQVGESRQWRQSATWDTGKGIPRDYSLKADEGTVLLMGEKEGVPIELELNGVTRRGWTPTYIPMREVEQELTIVIAVAGKKLDGWFSCVPARHPYLHQQGYDRFGKVGLLYYDGKLGPQLERVVEAARVVHEPASASSPSLQDLSAPDTEPEPTMAISPARVLDGIEL